VCDRANFLGFFLLYRLRFFFDDLTAEGAEGTEEEKIEMNNSDTNGFDITSKPLAAI